MANEQKGKTAEELAGKMREISVAEFFEKNRHLLGFDNPAKALLMVVKEALDNSIDAAEDARILPEVIVSIQQPAEVFRIINEEINEDVGKLTRAAGKVELAMGSEKAKFVEKKEPTKKESVYIFELGETTYKFRVYTEFKEIDGKKVESESYEFVRGRTPLKIQKIPADRFLVTIEDNGPGIVKEHIPRVFGKLLYGSKFAGGRQSRGQQGIGISAALLYAQLTTGKPAIILSRTGASKPVHYYELRIDTTKNEPIILEEKNLKDVPPLDGVKPVMTEHGIRVQLEIEGKYAQRYHGVEEYLKQTATVNPFAKIIYHGPTGEIIEYNRAVKELPPLPKPIKPHPHGVEMGMLERMAKLTSAHSAAGFLSGDFCRVGGGTADDILKKSGVKPSTKPHELDHEQIEKIFRTIQSYQFMKPPLDCLSPISEEKFMEGLKKEFKLDFVAAVSRPPSVYRGNPFIIEVAIGYGGSLPTNEPAKIMRFANRVPLLYQAASCATTKAAQKVDWRNYGIEQQGHTPYGPVVIAIHMASVWIPYVTEAKEAIDPYPEIIKQIRLALQDCGRKVQRFISGKRRMHESEQRQSLFEKYIPEAAEALAKLSDGDKGKIKIGLEKILKKGKVVVEEPLPEPVDANGKGAEVIENGDGVEQKAEE